MGFPSDERFGTLDYTGALHMDSWYQFRAAVTSDREQLRLTRVTAELSRTRGTNNEEILVQEELLDKPKVLRRGEAITVSGFSTPVPQGWLDTKPSKLTIRLEFSYLIEKGKWWPGGDAYAVGY